MLAKPLARGLVDSLGRPLTGRKTGGISGLPVNPSAAIGATETMVQRHGAARDEAGAVGASREILAQAPPIWPTTGAALASAMSWGGGAASHIWIFNQESIGATDLEGAADISERFGGEFITTWQDGGAHGTVQTVAGGSSGMYDAGDVFDPGSSSFAIVIGAEFTSSSTSSYFLLRRTTTGGKYLQSRVYGDGRLEWSLSDGTNSHQNACNNDLRGSPVILLLVYDMDAEVMHHSHTANSTGSTASTTGWGGVGGAATTLAFGLNNFSTHYDYDISFMGVFVGSAAEGMGSTERAAFETSLGIY